MAGHEQSSRMPSDSDHPRNQALSCMPEICADEPLSKLLILTRIILPYIPPLRSVDYSSNKSTVRPTRADASLLMRCSQVVEDLHVPESMDDSQAAAFWKKYSPNYSPPYSPPQKLVRL